MVTGHGLWRQTNDTTSKAFPTMEINPDSPKAPVDSKGREVPINSPEDLPAGYRRDEFPHQSARMAALVATVGTVAYDDDGMGVWLDDHFIVGTKCWLRVDGRASKDTQVLFTLNLRWKEVAWRNNEGIFQIITRVYRQVGCLMSAQDVARVVDCSDKEIYKMAACGEIPCVRITERMVRFDPGDLERWLASKRRLGNGS